MEGQRLPASEHLADPLPVCRTTGGVRWRVARDWQELIAQGKELPLENWLKQGNAVEVKVGDGRAIYRVDLPQGQLYVKRYRPLRGASLKRSVLRASPARREFETAVELARRDVSTARPVALGEEIRGVSVGENFLITESLVETCTLHEFLDRHLMQFPPKEQSTLRRRLTLSLARFTAAAHDAGVYHGDLHGGNVLLSLNSFSEKPLDRRLPKLHLIDTSDIRFSAPLNRADTIDSLIILFSDFATRSRRLEPLRFWRAYLGARRTFHSAKHQQDADQIYLRMVEYRKRIAARRDRRAVKSNRDFMTKKLAGRIGHSVSGLDYHAFISWLENPDRTANEHQVCPLNSADRGAIVRAEMPLDGQATEIAIKRFGAANLWEWLRSPRTGRRVKAAWQAGHALLQRGIPVEKPIAVCYPSRLRPLKSGYLATEWIAGGQDLTTFLWGLEKIDPAIRFKKVRELAIALGTAVGQLHFWNVAFRDLKACEIRIKVHEDPLSIYFTNIERVRFMRDMRDNIRWEDLAGLAASFATSMQLSSTAILRFLRAYQRGCGRRSHWKLAWEGVDRQWNRPSLPGKQFA